MKNFRGAIVFASIVVAASCGDSKEDNQKNQDQAADFSQIAQDYAEMPSGLIARVPVDANGYVTSEDAEIRSYYGEQFEDNYVETAFGNAPMADLYSNPYDDSFSDPYMFNTPNEILGHNGQYALYPGQNPHQGKGKGSVAQNPYQGKGSVSQNPHQGKGGVYQNPHQGKGQGKGPVYGPAKGKGGVYQNPNQNPNQNPGKGKGVFQGFNYLVDQATNIDIDYSFRLDFENDRRRRGNSGYGNDNSRYDHHDFLQNRFRPIQRSRYYQGYNWGYYQRPQRFVRNGYCYYYYPRPSCSGYNWCNSRY